MGRAGSLHPIFIPPLLPIFYSYRGSRIIFFRGLRKRWGALTRSTPSSERDSLQLCIPMQLISIKASGIWGHSFLKEHCSLPKCGSLPHMPFPFFFFPSAIPHHTPHPLFQNGNVEVNETRANSAPVSLLSECGERGARARHAAGVTYATVSCRIICSHGGAGLTPPPMQRLHPCRGAPRAPER